MASAVRRTSAAADRSPAIIRARPRAPARTPRGTGDDTPPTARRRRARSTGRPRRSAAGPPRRRTRPRPPSRLACGPVCGGERQGDDRLPARAQGGCRVDRPPFHGRVAPGAGDLRHVGRGPGGQPVDPQQVPRPAQRLEHAPGPSTAVRNASSGRPSHSASSVAAAWYAPWNWPSTGAPWSSSRSRSSWKWACSNSPRPTSSGIQRARPYRLAGGFDCSMSRTRASSAAWSQCPSSMAIMTALWPMNVP